MPLHDFDNTDYRLHGKLCVRLKFVETWAAPRTLTYYQAVRDAVQRLEAKMYSDGYYTKEGYRPKPQLYHGGTVYEQSFYTKWLNAPYYTEAFSYFMQDYEELVRYMNTLRWVLSKKDKVKHKRIRDKHPLSYFVR